MTDIPARARVITDEDKRADVLYRILTDGRANQPSKAQHILPRWVASSPLAEFNVT